MRRLTPATPARWSRVQLRDNRSCRMRVPIAVANAVAIWSMRAL